MKSFASIALLGASASALKYVNKETPCHRAPKIKKPDFIIEPLKHLEAIPDSYLWNNVDGVNYLTNVYN